MIRAVVLLVVVCYAAATTVVPGPCIAPNVFTARASQYDHLDDRINRFFVAYDLPNKRRALFEEQNVLVPGRQFREFLELGQEGVIYEINLTTKTCSKIPMRRPFRPFGIPSNATFENEFSIGGPGESIYATEWSDRIPLRAREYWVGVFSMQNCYPIREIIIADYLEVNSTITTQIYDLVQGISNPDDFIPPPECLQAQWAPRPSIRIPYW